MEGYNETPIIHQLFIDIETLPQGEMLSVEELMEQHPKSMKKEDTIRKWAESNQETELRSRALKSLKGRILCIAVAFDDEPVEILKYKENEKEILEDLTDYIRGLAKDGNIIYSTAFVGHNVKEFDMAWILHRAFKFGIDELARWIPTGRYTHRIIDTNQMFNPLAFKEYTSLNDLANFLGVGAKTEGINGSQVYDYFKAGKIKDIENYCKDDVDLTRRCYRKMEGK